MPAGVNRLVVAATIWRRRHFYFERTCAYAQLHVARDHFASVWYACACKKRSSCIARMRAHPSVAHEQHVQITRITIRDFCPD
jgi:hypothetical protein